MQIKLASVQLARKYMKRVASELDAMNEAEKEPNKEFLLLQGVRFAFRVHQVYILLHFFTFYSEMRIVEKCGIRARDIRKLLQFAGGFDAESMKAFEELRSRASTQSTTAENNEGE